MARLLLTTFNGPGHKAAAAMAFKRSAAALLQDRLEEADPELGGQSLWNAWPSELNNVSPDGTAPLLLKDTSYGPPWLALMRLSGAWPRLVRQHKDKVEEWFARLYSKPVHCWVVGGHHHGHHENGPEPNSRYRTMLWGLHQPTGSIYYPHVGFGLTAERNPPQRRFEWFGYTGATANPVAAIPMTGARTNLQQVRMMIVLGCNGVPYLPAALEWRATMGRSWQKWLGDEQTGRLPMIVGWRKVKSMPRDANVGKRFGTDLFAQKLTALAEGNDFLTLFDRRERIAQVIQCWGAACWQAFSSPPTKETPDDRARLRLLWRDCAVLAPDRTVWHANLTGFKGQQLEPPFDLTKPLPLTSVGVAP